MDDRARTRIAAVKHASILPESEKPADKRASSAFLQVLACCKILERAKGLEPSTPTFAR
jgi:hypothetical protein